MLRQAVIDRLNEVRVSTPSAVQPLKIIHCTAPLEVLTTRLQERTGDIADATAEVLAKQFFEPFTAHEVPFVVTIDTTQDLKPQFHFLRE